MEEEGEEGGIGDDDDEEEEEEALAVRLYVVAKGGQEGKGKDKERTSSTPSSSPSSSSSSSALPLAEVKFDMDVSDVERGGVAATAEERVPGKWTEGTGKALSKHLLQLREATRSLVGRVAVCCGLEQEVGVETVVLFSFV